MKGARNALYLEISYCPPGCREARVPPSLTAAKTGIAGGGWGVCAAVHIGQDGSCRSGHF